MKILLCGGIKTENIAKALRPRFVHGGTEILVEIDIANIPDLLTRGEYFDRMVVMEPAWTSDGSCMDEIEIRQKVAELIHIVKNKSARETTCVFIAMTDNMAQIVAEESIEIVSQCKVLVKAPPYDARFFTDATVKNLWDIPEKYVFDLESKIQEEYKSAEPLIWSVPGSEAPKDAEEELDAAADIQFKGEQYIFDDTPEEEEIPKSMIEDIDDFDKEFDSDGTGLRSTEFERLGEDFRHIEEDDLPLEFDTPDSDPEMDGEIIGGGEDEPEISDDIDDDPNEMDIDLGDEIELGDPDDLMLIDEEPSIETIDTGLFGDEDDLENLGTVGEDKDEAAEEEAESIKDDIWEDPEDWGGEAIEGEDPEADPVTEEDIDKMFGDDIELGSEPETTVQLTKEPQVGESESDDEDELEFDDDDTPDKGNALDSLFGSDEDELPIDEETGETEETAGESEEPEESEKVTESIDIDLFNPVDTEDTLEKFDDSMYTKEEKEPEPDPIIQRTQTKTSIFPSRRKEKPAKPAKEAKTGVQQAVNKASGANLDYDINRVRSMLDTYKNRGGTLVVTGTPCSGTSTLVFNLANIISSLGYTVLIVDMDTVNRTQAFMSAEAYDCVHSLEPENASLKQALNAVNNGISRYVNIVKPGFHLLTMGLAGDIVTGEKLAPKQKLARFSSNVRNNYNFVIYDIPFNTAIDYAADITFTADNIVLACESSNHGIMSMMLAMCNIDGEDMQEAMFNRAQICMTKYNGIRTALGSSVKNMNDVLTRLDREVQSLLGVDPEYYFSNMSICGMMPYNIGYEDGWFSKLQYSDTAGGREEFMKLLTNILLKK